MADDFKQAGYATGMFGKWHLGRGPELHPNRRGFNEFYGFVGGAHDYLSSADPVWGPYQHNGQPLEIDGYLTDVLARRAAEFISENRERSFFMYVPFNAVHPPHQAPENLIQRVDQLAGLDDGQKDLAATLQGLDDAVGLIVSTLEASGLREKTLVIFTSDNGRPKELAMPWDRLRGGREQFWDGGWRIPMVWSWPGMIPADSIYPLLVSHLDMRATFQALVERPAEQNRPLDGVDLLPHILGQATTSPHEYLYGRLGPTWAVRHQKWKLILPFGRESTELYDIEADPYEESDIAAEHPEIRRQLQESFDKWNSELVEPAWPYPPGSLRRQSAG
jgi:arylsulfatase A-like enzyme